MKSTVNFDKTYNNISSQIIDWLRSYAQKSKSNGFVVGVSGGVDSAVVSTLCAITGYKTIVVELPIKRTDGDIANRSRDHIEFLKEHYVNVVHKSVDLTSTFNDLMGKWSITDCITDLASANVRSRLRMVALYTFANSYNFLVAGTGNKVEDYGVGFFTKYGDGGVDISPIGSLSKSEVRELATYLGISKEIVRAKPTDELWVDGRTDEDQIGCSYPQLEWAMEMFEEHGVFNDASYYSMLSFLSDTGKLTDEHKTILTIYHDRHFSSAHKMSMPPVCPIRRN